MVPQINEERLNAIMGQFVSDGGQHSRGELQSGWAYLFRSLDPLLHAGLDGGGRTGSWYCRV